MDHRAFFYELGKLVYKMDGVPRSTANTIRKDLEGKGFVALSQIKGERRELLVSLTASGKEYADGILSDLYKREREVYDQLDDPQSTLGM